MRLISCHIENFGKLSDLSIDFQSGVNSICEDNGWGKSTLAAFIRAMFYGLDKNKKRSILENDRKRYLPWQKGVYGGSLVFEIDNKQYLINRIFAEKDSEDEFELRDYKTNLISSDYSENIGEELFQIDRDSFARTAFIEQSMCETGATDDINAKLGNLVDNSGDINSFDNAIDALKKIMNTLTPNRMTGSIKKRVDEIASYERMIADKPLVINSMNKYQDMLKEQEEELENVIAERDECIRMQSKVSKIQSVMAKKSEWDRLRKDVADKENKVQSLRNLFPLEVPDKDHVKESVDMSKALLVVKERLDTVSMGENETGKFSYLKSKFALSIPSEKQIQEKLEDNREILRIKQQISSEAMSAEEKLRLEELSSKYLNDEEDVYDIMAKWNNRLALSSALPSNQAALTALNAAFLANKRKKGTSVIALIIGLIIFVSGILGIALKMLSVGIALIGLGVVITVAAFIMKQSGKTANDEMLDLDSLKNKIKEDEGKIISIDREVSSYISLRGKNYSSETAGFTLQRIAEEINEYKALSSKSKRINLNNEETEKIHILTESIKNFLASYGMNYDETRFDDSLHELRMERTAYLDLFNKNSRFLETKAEYDRLSEELRLRLLQYGFKDVINVWQKVEEIKDNLALYQAALELLEDDIEDLSQFEATNDLNEIDESSYDENLPSLSEISDKLASLTDKADSIKELISNYTDNLESLQNELDECLENEERLSVLKDIQAEEKNKYKYVSIAYDKLAEAKESMTAKYSKPLLASFKKYYEFITKMPAEDYNIDANSVITVNELGKQRDVETLSAGYRDLIGICMRIALVDAMYQDEKPVIIMDDPFTNLDDNKVVMAKELLKEIAKSYQVIYFTCSTTRK